MQAALFVSFPCLNSLCGFMMMEFFPLISIICHEQPLRSVWPDLKSASPLTLSCGWCLITKHISLQEQECSHLQHKFIFPPAFIPSLCRRAGVQWVFYWCQLLQAKPLGVKYRIHPKHLISGAEAASPGQPGTLEDMWKERRQMIARRQICRQAGKHCYRQGAELCASCLKSTGDHQELLKVNYSKLLFPLPKALRRDRCR